LTLHRIFISYLLIPELLPFFSTSNLHRKKVFAFWQIRGLDPNEIFMNQGLGDAGMNRAEHKK
jgi:hypothetical protein